MSALNLCSRETVAVTTLCGDADKPAWRAGDLACHQGIGPERNRWIITHLPTGLSFSEAGTFDNAEHAAEAMLELSRSRNDWSVIEEGDLRSVGETTKAVFQRFLAAPPNTKKCQKIRDLSHRALNRRINGYGSPLEGCK